MAVQFTYDVGYMGVVKLAQAPMSGSPQGNPIQVLSTSGSIQVEQNPIYSSGVWGAGWYNAAQQVAFAPNFITLSGTVGYELTAGDVFDVLRNFAFEDRANPAGYPIWILPNGTAGYTGNAWCESMSFSASQDAIVTGDFGYKSGNVSSCIETTGALIGQKNEDYTNPQGSYTEITYTDPQSKIGKSNGTLPFGMLDVYPFWASGVYVNAKAVDYSSETQDITLPADATVDTYLPDIMDWNTSYSSELVLGKLCTADQATVDSQEADYAALGTMTAQGSFTMFSVSKQLDPNKIRECRKCSIVLGPASNPSAKSEITYGAVVFGSGSTDIQTGSSFTQSSFNFTALGDGSKPVMSLKKVSDLHK